MKLKTKLLALVLPLLVFSSCSNKDNNKAEQQYKETFYVDKNNDIVEKDEIGDRIVLNWYSDPSCGACLLLESQTRNHKNEFLADDAVINHNLVAYLNDYSVDASSIILATVNTEPDIAPELYDAIVDEEFFDTVRKAQYSDFNSVEKIFKEQYDKIGGKDWNKIIKLKPEMEKIIRKNTEHFATGQDIEEISSIEGPYTPFLYTDEIGKSLEIFRDGDPVSDIKKMIEDSKNQK